MKSDDIIAAINGYTIEADRRLKIELARGHLDYLDEMITKTEVELYIRIKPYWHLVELIASMPGMTEISATLTLADYEPFVKVAKKSQSFFTLTSYLPFV